MPGDSRPEDVFYNFLRTLQGNDAFWGGTGGYTQQVCFKNQPSISTDRHVMKNWFVEQSQYWGRGCSKLFNRWKKDNDSTVKDFKLELEETLEQILKKLKEKT